VDFYLRLNLTTGEEQAVVLILLNRKDWKSGACYTNIKPYLRLVPTACAGAGRGTITYNLTYSLITSLP